jgi:hypothetical protein
MARNQSQDYATMDDDERRKFAGAPPAEGTAAELDFEDPRDAANQGHSQIDREVEADDVRHRDGMAAQLDESAHEDATRKASRK